MPDITMCTNHNCPHNKTCYRFTATPNEWRQSYAHFEPDEKDAFKSCEHFMYDRNIYNVKGALDACKLDE